MEDTNRKKFMMYHSSKMVIRIWSKDIMIKGIDSFPKRHRLAHNGGFLKFAALYCSLNMVSSTEIS